MHSKFFLLFLSFSFYISTTAFTQYAFDVKTLLEEKGDLQNYKQGLLSSISSSGWASVKDVGEDYSLWITNLERTHFEDSVIVSLIVELRTPSMFTRGDHIGGRQIWLKYHWDNAEKYATDNIDDFNFESDEHASFDEALNNLSSTAGLVTSMGLMDVSGLSNDGVASLVQQLGNLMKRNPSPMELLESLYLGEQALLAAREIIKDEGSN